MSKPVAFVVSYMVPSATGAGGPIGLHGHLLSVQGAGFDVHCVHVGEENPPNESLPYPVHCLRVPSRDFAAAQAAMTTLARTEHCALIWTHHALPWPAVAHLRNQIPHAVLAGDPEWQIVKLRQSLRRPPANLKERLGRTFRSWKTVRGALREEKEYLPQAAQRGVVAGWSPNDVPGLRERTHLDVKCCSLAFPDWGVRREAPRHDVVMVGNLGGTQTRLGLHYFFSKVWPTWQDAVDAPRSRVRVVGGGKLPPHFPLPAPHKRLDWVGFVDSIEEVWTTAVAHLVAVPTPLGFRVRIAESLCRGVPVLSHPSAESGLPMLKHGENYLACSTPADWLDAVKRLESDAGLAALLAQNGRKAFDQHLSIVVGLERFGSLSEQAIKRFHNS